MNRHCSLCDSHLSTIIFMKNGYSLAQCAACGLVYVANPPSQTELGNLYSFNAGYHKEFQNNYSEYKNHHKIAKEHYHFLKKYKSQGRLFDIGCSAGFFLKLAKENGWETYGLEINKGSARIARERYGLEVTIGTLDQADFEPKSFDVITMWDVIEHVRNPMKTMSVINRLLKEDGIIALSTPNIDGLFPKLSYLLYRCKIINYWPHPEPPYHLFQFSKRTIFDLLKLTGFNLLKIYDKRNLVSYIMGQLKSSLSFRKRLLYSAIFIPLLISGPIVRRGDWVVFVARKIH